MKLVDRVSGLVGLRTRLFLAFAVFVSLLLGVGATSYRIHAVTSKNVRALSSGHAILLEPDDIGRVGLELEGEWDLIGRFVANEVELIPGQGRPKLRGSVQAIDPENSTFTMYGVEVACDARTEWLDSEGAAPLRSLQPGDRIEVTCDAGLDGWLARKVRTRDVKTSDKVKGTPTLPDRSAPNDLDLFGLPILLAAVAQELPPSPLRDLASSTRVLLALQDYRAAASALVAWPAEGSEELRVALAELSELAAATEESDALPGAELRNHVNTLKVHAGRLETLAGTSTEAAQEFLINTVEPLLEGALRPPALARLSRSIEDLGDELRSAEQSTSQTAQLALLTTAFAAFAALALSWVLWRSIRTPLDALQLAAEQIGNGRLDTRVEVRSHDELGRLGYSFNAMARRLASSTLSIDNLESVLDSMAAGLFVLGSDSTITSVNQAALNLLGFQRHELVGTPFARLTASELDDPSDERVFTRGDGSTLLVSLSVAELRATRGALRGHVCVAVDLTERKRLEAQLRESLSEKELLLREVHHRVKNNMQVISSVLDMQSALAGDRRVAESFGLCQARIRSMALIHEQLHSSSDLGRIDLRTYLGLLVHHVVQSFGLVDRVQVDADLEDLALGVDRSLSCGLIINELVSNAFRHGGDSLRRIRVTLALRADGEVELAVVDDGQGLSEGRSGVSSALGLRLVETLTEQLGGDLDVSSGPGVAVRVTFPFAATEPSHVLATAKEAEVVAP